MKPIIGISADYNWETGKHCLGEGYVASVRQAGGSVMILPPGDNEALIEEYLEICHGLILSGGGDIDPIFWNEGPSFHLGEINPRRDSFELALAKRAMELDLPVLGICRGCQLLNVAAGGTLIQHIASGFCHDQKAPRDYPVHAIVIEPETILERIIGLREIRVNSFHHQAIGVPGQGFTITARAADGTVEAIESRAHRFALGLQWHPETMNDPLSQRIFYRLVRVSAE